MAKVGSEPQVEVAVVLMSSLGHGLVLILQKRSAMGQYITSLSMPRYDDVTVCAEPCSDASYRSQSSVGQQIQRTLVK